MNIFYLFYNMIGKGKVYVDNGFVTADYNNYCMFCLVTPNCLHPIMQTTLYLTERTSFPENRNNNLCLGFVSLSTCGNMPTQRENT